MAPSDEAMSLRFEEISPEAGNLEQFKGFVQAAHKKGEETQKYHDVKHIRSNYYCQHAVFSDDVSCVSAGISVVLDLTPNYQGSSGPWFSNISVTNVAERLKVRETLNRLCRRVRA